MLRQRIRVLFAELLEQARRARDIGEEEGDGPGRQLAHAVLTIARPPANHLAVVPMPAELDVKPTAVLATIVR